MASRINQEIVHKKPKVVDNIDRNISDLPDSILCHILSFLPSHSAVRTSLISKRWKNLWIYVDTVNFDCFNKKWRKRSFVRFVNMVLMYHNVLKKFSLVWTKICDKEDIHPWLYWATAIGVQHLNLQNYKNGRMKLPTCVYSCKTLEVLELRGQILINCPENICLPKLKTLSLINVCYRGGERDVIKLIPSCPMLQSLYVERDEYDNVTKFVISSPVLKKLKVTIYDDGSFENRSDKEKSELCLEINTPKLENLYLMDDVSETYSIVDVSSLVRANVNLKIPMRLSDEKKDQRVHSFARLMQALHKVENLHIAVLSIADNIINWSEPSHVPRCVYSCLKAISIDVFRGRQDELSVLCYILENAQVLQTVKLHASTNKTQTKFQVLQKIAGLPRKSQACRIEYL